MLVPGALDFIKFGHTGMKLSFTTLKLLLLHMIAVRPKATGAMDLLDLPQNIQPRELSHSPPLDPIQSFTVRWTSTF